MVTLDFEEILKPFTEEEAIAEAKRCLKCKKPLCVGGCPIKNFIPEFITEIANGDYKKAKEILDTTTNMSSICSRVCNHEAQCVGHCILNRKHAPIDVGRLERFVSDYDFEHGEKLVKKPVQFGVSVAIIGSGPAGIACAKQLAKNNIRVTIYEKENFVGGQLIAGIPEYRLQNEIVQREVDELQRLGVRVFLNTNVGEELLLKDLQEDYDYILLGVGASKSKSLRIEGVELEGVLQASDYLKQVSLHSSGLIDSSELAVKEGDRVLVIGGGNVAIDASRTSKRFTNDVSIVYRRWREVMPASDFEYNESVHDNIDYMWKRTPLSFVGENGKLTGMKVMNTNDDDNNFEEIIPCDKVLIAIGSDLDNGVFNEFEEVKLNDAWFIEADNCKVVGFDNMYVAGDATLSPSTVVEAVQTGIACADRILGSIVGNELSSKFKSLNGVDESLIIDAISKLVSNNGDITDVLKKIEE